MKYDRFRLRLVSSLGVILDNIQYQKDIFSQGAIEEKQIEVLDKILQVTKKIVIFLDVKCKKEEVLSEIKRSIKEMTLAGSGLRKKRPELNQVFISKTEKNRISENDYLELMSVQEGYLQLLYVMAYLGKDSPLTKTINKYRVTEEIQEILLNFKIYKDFFEKEILFLK